MSTPTEPATSYDLFGRPLGKAGELVPIKSLPSLRRTPTAAATPDMSTSERPSTDNSSSTAEEQRRRLEAQCQRLRATHRCPGRCVLSGALRESGLATFQRLTEA